MTELLAPLTAYAACKLMQELTGRHFDPESPIDRNTAAAAMETMLEDDKQREILLDRIGAQIRCGGYENDPH